MGVEICPWNSDPDTVTDTGIREMQTMRHTTYTGGAPARYLPGLRPCAPKIRRGMLRLHGRVRVVSSRQLPGASSDEQEENQEDGLSLWWIAFILWTIIAWLRMIGDAIVNAVEIVRYILS